ncbi:cytochrome bd ubiquinol oxidase subunit I domain protein [Burkholderia pseudomallei MSHR2138]|nr:cytochrome bd ubiquinol oxidase subunit I domain protein [Burkholderia pseudomallei MSHR2138]
MSRRPFSRCHAAVAATTSAATTNAAIAMCASRYGNDGLKMIANQSVGTTWPSTISKPCGVCIQLFDARIQNVEISVPIATISVAPKCARGLTRFQPNSMMPRKPASRKNAVITSYISSGPVTEPAKLEKPDQFVPN